MRYLLSVALAFAIVGAGRPAEAGEVKVSFANGLVTVIATDASPREILTEWARLGGARITNLDRLSGSPVTLQLTSVPETQALEAILMGTAGFVAAPRRQPERAMASYDRILLLPGAAPTVPTSPAPASVQPAAPFMRGRLGQPVFGPTSDYQRGRAWTPQGYAPAWTGRSQAPAGFGGSGMQGQAGSAPAPTPGNSFYSEVPGIAPGQSGAPGATRPGEATAPPKTPGQIIQPGGPIKIPG